MDDTTYVYYTSPQNVNVQVLTGSNPPNGSTISLAQYILRVNSQTPASTVNGKLQFPAGTTLTVESASPAPGGGIRNAPPWTYTFNVASSDNPVQVTQVPDL